MTVEYAVDESYFGSWRERVVDDWHETNIYDHEGGDIAYFIIEVWALDEGEESEDGDEDQRDENGQCVHDGILVEGNGEGDHFE